VKHLYLDAGGVVEIPVQMLHPYSVDAPPMRHSRINWDGWRFTQSLEAIAPNSAWFHES
jgi:hypothetical protein